MKKAIANLEFFRRGVGCYNQEIINENPLLRRGQRVLFKELPTVSIDNGT